MIQTVRIIPKFVHWRLVEFSIQKQVHVLINHKNNDSVCMVTKVHSFTKSGVKRLYTENNGEIEENVNILYKVINTEL